MREYVLLLAALALGARAAEPLQDHGGAPLRSHRPFPAAASLKGMLCVNGVCDRPVQVFPAGLGENKRQGLIPFPRVGRSENADPRTMPAAWLVAPEYYPGKRVASWMPSSSPRLGRQNKRFETDNAAWTLVNVRDYPAMNRPQRGRDSASFTPRLGRELESDEEVAVHDATGLGPQDDLQGSVRL
uniref:Capa variant b n=1 Tax=Frankliniella occidentalis TaxID=133901 RepID=A0AA96T9U8_FRAOC|nr:capa variant b [Frankliniella occidentalis]